MDEYIGVLRRCPLFDGISAGDMKELLGCLSAVRRSFGKGWYFLRAGEETGQLGVVLSGSVSVVKEDFWGNRSLMTRVGPGDIFAETYACSQGAPLGVSVVAEEDSVVLFIDAARILTTCPSACRRHSRIMRNLLSAMAAKNLMLSEKLTHMSQRGTREKLLSYLSAEAAKHSGASFVIPFDRQGLADYLSVDRSAMSTELGKLRDEGLVSFRKNSFTLHAGT